MIFSMADLIIVGAMRAAVAALFAALTAVSLPAAGELTLDEVLLRASKYVANYQSKLRGIVAEETYRQNLMVLSAGRPIGAGARRSSREGRELKSDLLLVKLGDEDFWMQFRDVFEVDRKPVRDRDQRLYKLFVDGTADARKLAENIQQESARYNLGPVMRTINVPILALFMLDRSVQSNVQFEQGKTGNVKRFSGLADPATIWLLEYRESHKGTMVRGENNRDIPSRGRIWVDSTDGRILQTELISEDVGLRAEINVTYRTEPGFDLLVPAEMRELYIIRRSDTRIDGRATYGHFRQFSVSTTEKPKS
jgi:hypothetical protein